jgi:hypothetical protein
MDFLSRNDITQILWLITHKQKETLLKSISDRIYFTCHEMGAESVFCLALKHNVSSRCIALNLWQLLNRVSKISLNYLQLWMLFGSGRVASASHWYLFLVAIFQIDIVSSGCCISVYVFALVKLFCESYVYTGRHQFLLWNSCDIFPLRLECVTKTLPLHDTSVEWP